MRFVTVYLVAYFALLGGAALVLWRSGILEQIPPSWAVIGLAAAVGLGVLLGLVSRPTSA